MLSWPINPEIATEELIKCNKQVKQEAAIFPVSKASITEEGRADQQRIRNTEEWEAP
jgi:hypothetical protein